MTISSGVCEGLLLDDCLTADDLSGSLLAINGMKLLEFASEQGGIKLTASGAFNRKSVEWAAETFQWPNHTPEILYSVCKVLNEHDHLPLHVMHHLMLKAGLLRKYRNTARLSPAARKMLGDHGQLQVLQFETCFTRFDFEAVDWMMRPDISYDMGFVLDVVDTQLTGWVPLEAFAEMCLPVYAHLEDRAQFSVELSLHSHVLRPLTWLGLIEEQETQMRFPRREDRRLRKTKLFNKFLRFADADPESCVLH